MNSELQILGLKIENAKRAEEIFGPLASASVDEALRKLTGIYKQLAKRSFPDAFVGDKESYEYAEKVFAKLANFRKDAENKLRQEIYGKHNGSAPASATRVPAEDDEVVVASKYVRYASLASGDLCDVHRVRFDSAGKTIEGLLKMARELADNELLMAERVNLDNLRKAMASKLKKNDWLTCIPEVYDSFLIADGSKKTRANILESFDGFLTAEEIQSRLAGGVDGRTIAWMWKRLLGLLDWIHGLGYLHGAVLPPHVLYFPDDDANLANDLRRHSVRLIDWCYSLELKATSRLKAWCPQYEEFYAPEILGKKLLSPQTDLYMAAKTMVYLLGGNAKDNTFPVSVPAEIIQSLLLCLEKNPDRRPGNPQSYFDSFVRVLEKLYGKPKYHRFTVPLTY